MTATLQQDESSSLVVQGWMNVWGKLFTVDVIEGSGLISVTARNPACVDSGLVRYSGRPLLQCSILTQNIIPTLSLSVTVTLCQTIIQAPSYIGTRGQMENKRSYSSAWGMRNNYAFVQCKVRRLIKHICITNKIQFLHVYMQWWIQKFWKGGAESVAMLRGSGGRKSPSGVQGRSPGGGLGAKPPEAKKAQRKFCA